MSITLRRIYRMGVCIHIVHNSSQTPEKNEMALFSYTDKILGKRKIEDATATANVSLHTWSNQLSSHYDACRGAIQQK